jgi:hypothetical protein
MRKKLIPIAYFKASPSNLKRPLILGEAIEPRLLPSKKKYLRRYLV